MSSPPPAISRKTLLLVALLASAVRVIYFCEHANSVFFAMPQLDSLYFDRVARAFAAGNWNDPHGGFRALLYPALVSIPYRIDAGTGLLLTIVLQHLLGVGAAVGVGSATARLGGERAGLCAGVVYALAPVPLFFEGELLADSLLTSLAAALLWSIAEATAREAWRAWLGWALVGALVGTMAAVRPNIIVFGMVAPILTLAICLRREDSRWLPPVAIFPAMGLILLLAAGATSLATGRFEPLPSQGGINLYLGNNLRADGMVPRQGRYYNVPGDYRDSVEIYAERRYGELARERGLPTRPTPAQVSRFWTREAVGEVLASPRRWAGLMARKATVLWWNREIPNFRDFDFTKKYESWVLWLLPARFWVVFALALVGIREGWRTGSRLLLFWLLALLGTYGATIIAFFVCDRLRLPLWPILATLAGVGAQALLSGFDRRGPDRRRLPANVALFAAAALFSLVNWWRVPPFDHGRDYFYRSLAHLARGNTAEAVEDARAAVVEDPSNPDSTMQLGNALIASHNYVDARAVFAALLLRDPLNAQAMNNLGVAAEEAGDYRAALEAYLRAAETDPAYASPLVNAGLLLIRGGDKLTGQRLLDAADGMEPGRADVLYGKALLARYAGEASRAAELLEKAMRTSQVTVRRLMEEDQRMPRPDFQNQPGS